MTNYLLLLLVSVVTCGGQLCQKKAVQCWQQQPPATRLTLTLRWVLVAVLLLIFGMLLWLRLLQSLPLSVAYPMLSINFVLVTLCAQFFFGETVNRRHWLGIACIMLGISCIGLSQ